MNECSKNSSNSCEQVCVNTPGSYTCRCQTGHRINSSNGMTCEGEPHAASDIAIVTVMVAHAEIHECDENIHVCEQICINTNGSYTCACNPGYTLTINGFTCQSKKRLNSLHALICDASVLDIDECELGTDLCDHSCLDTYGSYMCSCRRGYHLSTDGFTCSGMKT